MAGRDGGNIIKIDYDYDLDSFLSKFLEKYERIGTLLYFKIEYLKIYRTRGGFHIELYINKYISGYELVFFQLLFESDYTREMFNIRRVRRRIRHWNILYDGKYDNLKKKFVHRKLLRLKSRKLMKEMRRIDEND